jgi:pilus assembly protein TadC
VSLPVLLAGGLAGLAVVVMLLPAGVAGLARALPAAAPLRRVAGRSPTPELACGLAALALALLLAPPWGLLAGAGAALAGPRALSRLEPRRVREAHERLLDDLPLLLDLLAACLAGGASLPAAAAAVADALPGPAGRRLSRVCAALAVGTPAADAWAALGGGSDADPLAPAARALARAAEGGAPVAAAVARLAAEARAEVRARGERGARRVGVLAVAPLGLCFLPAFVLLGVVPVVIGLAGPLLAGL